MIPRGDVVPTRIVHVPADAAHTAEAASILDGFARRTGLLGGRSVRYLWTDAFAVHALLAVGERTGEERWASLAGILVDEVHAVLGRARTADGSLGDWLAGSAEIARAHPTRGGLRIGKPLHERERGETLDPRLEWERDGQYFHYLVWWMRALERAAVGLGRPELARWAIELAQRAHAAFAHGPPGSRGLYWKMSVRLDRPLVPSQGQHDAVDAIVTYAELERARAGSPGPSLAAELADASTMLDPRRWATSDALGIGGLLLDAQRALTLERAGAWAWPELLDSMMGAALTGLHALPERWPADPERRLAFRELGLAIGLRAIARERTKPWTSVLPRHTRDLLDAIAEALPIADGLERFWRRTGSREARQWRHHREIDEVMLACCLLPEACAGTLLPLDGGLAAPEVETGDGNASAPGRRPES